MATYKVIEKIGEGGMGVVYRARQTTLERDVALKLLLCGEAARPNDLARFAREVRSIARISHPNVIRILDYGTIDRQPFYAMEYLRDAHTLGELVRGKGPLSIERIIAVTRALLDALAAVHRHGLIHRDIKPGNIMVTADDRLTLMDFGLVKDLEGSSMTRSGMMIGTPRYLSPEAVQAEPVDARSDLFSVGVMLHECLTGKRLFQGDTLPALAVQIVNHTPAPLRSERPECPLWLADLVSRLLAKDPDRRPRSSVDALNELHAGLGEPAQTPPPAPGDPPPSTAGAALPESTILGGLGALREELVPDQAAAPAPARPRTTRKTGTSRSEPARPSGTNQQSRRSRTSTLALAAGTCAAVFALTLAILLPWLSPAGTTKETPASAHASPPSSPTSTASPDSSAAARAAAAAMGSAITSLAPAARVSDLRTALKGAKGHWFRTPPHPDMLMFRKQAQQALAVRADRVHLAERITAFIPLRGEFFTSPAVPPKERLDIYLLINDLLDLEHFCDRFGVAFAPMAGRALHASYGQTTSGALAHHPAAGYAFTDSYDSKAFRAPADLHSGRWSIADVPAFTRFHGPDDPETSDVMKTLGEGAREYREFEGPEPLPIPLAQAQDLELSGWIACQDTNSSFWVQLSDGSGWRTVAIVRGMTGEEPRRFWHTVDRGLFTGSRLSLRVRFEYMQDMQPDKEFGYLHQVQVHHRP